MTQPPPSTPTARPTPINWTRAPCRHTAPRDGTVEDHRWYPERADGTSNVAHAEKATCATCPIQAGCLEASVARNEPAGIWGGAGELERRFLRRAWVADGRRAGPRYALQAGLFVGRLRSQVAGGTGLVVVPDRNGPGAVDGRLSTYAKGSRTPACKQAASFNAVLGAVTAPKRTARKRVAA